MRKVTLIAGIVLLFLCSCKSYQEEFTINRPVYEALKKDIIDLNRNAGIVSVSKYGIELKDGTEYKTSQVKTKLPAFETKILDMIKRMRGLCSHTVIGDGYIYFYISTGGAVNHSFFLVNAVTDNGLNNFGEYLCNNTDNKTVFIASSKNVMPVEKDWFYVYNEDICKKKPI